MTVPGLQRTADGLIAKSTKASAALRCARDTHRILGVALRVRTEPAHRLLDRFEHALRSDRRDQPGAAGAVLRPLARQPRDRDLDRARAQAGDGLLQDLRAGIVD